MDNEIKVVLLFVGLGALMGVISGVSGLTGYQGFLLALVFFYVSYRISPSIIDKGENSKDMSTGDIIKTGIIPYWFLWLVLWTLSYTLLL